MAGAALAVPVEAVFLLPLVNRSAQELFQCFELDLLFCEHLREERLELFNVLRENVGRFCFGTRWQFSLSISFSIRALRLPRPVRLDGV